MRHHPHPMIAFLSSGFPGDILKFGDEEGYGSGDGSGETLVGRDLGQSYGCGSASGSGSFDGTWTDRGFYDSLEYDELMMRSYRR